MTATALTCPKCRGCGQIASDDEGSAWTFWEELPPGSDLAVRLGLVWPVECPSCGGSGSRVPVPVEPERASREGDSQPLPIVNDAPDVQAAVIVDIEARRELGIRRYGTALQPNNGRNALLDAYEEALDLAMYLKQRLIEEAQR